MAGHELGVYPVSSKKKKKKKKKREHGGLGGLRKEKMNEIIPEWEGRKHTKQF